MKVRTQDLRAFADVLFQHLENTGRSEIDIPHDYYWKVEASDVFDPMTDPSNINLGQLSDDLSELQSIADGNMPPVGLALVWLSSILRAVGEEAGY